MELLETVDLLERLETAELLETVDLLERLV
jgi:hypothetical protein